MKTPSFLIAVLLSWAFASPTLGQALFLIQGQDYQAMRAAVMAQGAPVQEEFRLINSVAATLTDHQRQTLNKHPSVVRIIDHVDAIDSLEDDSDTASSCAYAGSIFTTTQDSRLTWPIVQKGGLPTVLKEVNLKWPAHWGNTLNITLDGRVIPHSSPESDDKHARLHLVVSRELTKKKHELELRFDHPSPNQSELEISLTFKNGCTTTLAKSYELDNNDTYFNGLIGADALHELNVLGQGVSIAILDSGLWNHPNLELDSKGNKRVLARFDATIGREVENLPDDSGHGTHISSVAANSGTVEVDGLIRYQGAAPDAYLVPIKAFDVNGQATLIHLLRALQWIGDNHERLNIRVLNLSFASHPRWPYWLDPVNQAVIRLWQQGIVAIASVGNSGPDPMTVGAPANIPYIISVGAITDNWTPSDASDDFVPLFSSQGPSPLGHVKPDIVAPGGHIEGLTRPGSTLTTEHPEFMKSPNRIAMTGTSQAAAVVSGAAALLLQLEPDLTPDQVKCRLTSSAHPAILPDGKMAYSPLKQGSGLINIISAITVGHNECDNGQGQLAQEINGEVFFTGPVELDDQGRPIIPESLKGRMGLDPALDAPAHGVAWGVKAHVERLSKQELDDPSHLQAFWIERYGAEIERLKSSQQAH